MHKQGNRSSGSAVGTSSQLVENLVFQGGSVKGTAYLGALDQLMQDNVISLSRIKRTCGASAGAITALFLALGKDFNNEIYPTVKDLDFASLLDDEKYTSPSALSYKDTVFKIVAIFNVEKMTLSIFDVLIYLGVKCLEKWLGIDFSKLNEEDIQETLEENRESVQAVFKTLITTIKHAGEWLANQAAGLSVYAFETITSLILRVFKKGGLIKIENLLLIEYFGNNKRELTKFSAGLYRIVEKLWSKEPVGIFSGTALWSGLVNTLKAVDLIGISPLKNCSKKIRDVTT